MDFPSAAKFAYVGTMYKGYSETIAGFHPNFFIIHLIYCAKSNGNLPNPSTSPSRNIDGPEIEFSNYRRVRWDVLFTAALIFPRLAVPFCQFILIKH